jgi:Lon protease-like protein
LPPSILRQPGNKTLTKVIDNFWPEAIQARREVAAAEDLGAEGGMNVPLFICTLGFPNQPTFLRVFEPRYRLMIRRCLEGNQQFGMLMYNRYNEPQGDLGPVHFYHGGTMLRIVNAQLLPDGTSIIETRGTYRFRVTAHGVLDGYSVGTVEPLEDVPLEEEQRIEAAEVARTPTENSGDIAVQIDRMPTLDLLRLGHEFVRRMRARSANWLQQRVLDIHGQPPDDAALFPYWFASVLPISDEEKYKLLDTRTVRERLKITALWIRRIESQRWYVPFPF